MIITENKKIYKIIEEAKEEGLKVILEFTYYDYEGDWVEKMSFILDRTFKTVLNDYEFMRTLPRGHFLRELSVKDIYKEGTSCSGTFYAFAYNICETVEYSMGQDNAIIKIGNIRIDVDEFSSLCRQLLEDYDKYFKTKI